MDDKNKDKIQEMIRVNHAGEFGAQKIYNAQIKYSKNKKLKKKLQHIAAEELVHLDYFEKENIHPSDSRKHIKGKFYTYSFAKEFQLKNKICS